MIKDTRIIMGMPITLMVHDGSLTKKQINDVFAIFTDADAKYSPYKSDSEVSQLNDMPLLKRRYSSELTQIMLLAEQTKQDTDGYFDVHHKGTFDPSGIVKGWAIQKAAAKLGTMTDNYYMEAGGDIQVAGVAEHGTAWRIGVRNPFNRDENVSVVALENAAIATSGTAIRGAHIYDPVSGQELKKVVSLSVIADRILDADRMATAAFAMGEKGLEFLNKLRGYEAYVIYADGSAAMTGGWKAVSV